MVNILSVIFIDCNSIVSILFISSSKIIYVLHFLVCLCANFQLKPYLEFFIDCQYRLPVCYPVIISTVHGKHDTYNFDG